MKKVKEEKKEVLVPEVVEDKSLVKQSREQAKAPARLKQEIRDIDPNFLKRLATRSDLSEYIMERVMENVTSAEELLGSLRGALKAGLISEKMFEAAGKLVESISKLLEQANKVKMQEEKFSVEAERVWVEKMRLMYGKSDILEPPPGSTNNYLIMTREAALDEIAKRAMGKKKKVEEYTD